MSGSVQVTEGIGMGVVRMSGVVLGLVACVGCGQGGQDPTPGDATGARVAVTVAPLSLAEVDDACFGLTVYGGPTTAAPIVWSERVCSSRFGDGAGGLAYVGPCDASAGTNTVGLVLEDLCSGGPCGDSAPGPTSIDEDTWRNPCRGPLGCVRQASCEPNRDTPVSFDLTVARSASQGFFDVAVEFADIFCSAKVDCEDPDGEPLVLLHDPDTGVRGRTVVVAWTCTAGPSTTTWLYFDNVVVTCFDDAVAPPAVIGSWAYDPSLGPGNTGPGSAPFVFQSAVYTTATALTGIAAWSLALGILPQHLPGRCVLTGRATASETRWTDGRPPAGATYPAIELAVTLSEGAGALACGAHALDVEGSGVSTGYLQPGDPRAFSHVMHGGSLAVSTYTRTACDAVVASLTDGVSFATSPEGLTVRIGEDQSPFYPLPAGLGLEGCCGACCD
ncbi:MAG: hypothetical protein IT385_22310 [Deltaproteobacteria bacterium]|nr:hypothetical protein [Deltaproteobacteria bacterium]